MEGWPSGGKLWLPSGGWARGIPTMVIWETVMKNRKVEARKGEEKFRERARSKVSKALL